MSEVTKQDFTDLKNELKSELKDEFKSAIDSAVVLLINEMGTRFGEVDKRLDCGRNSRNAWEPNCGWNEGYRRISKLEAKSQHG